jgi:hypothetical protein
VIRARQIIGLHHAAKKAKGVAIVVVEPAPHRRRDVQREFIVEEGVKRQRTLGSAPARRYLESLATPEHIILRVLASAAFRRKNGGSGLP